MVATTALYSAQKANQTAQAQQQLARLKQEQRRQARELQRQREDLERHQARAGRQAKHANQAKILVDRKQERSQATAGKQRRDHRDARQTLLGKVRDAAREVEQDSAITLHAPTPQRHPGREVLALQALCLPHGTRKALDLRLCLGQRVGLIGANGSGKSTLLRLLNGELPASPDNVRLIGETALLDQHCSTLAGNRSVLEHLRQANPTLAQGKLRSRLAQLGLDAARIELPSSLLSGGERMKAALAAVLYRERPLDLLLLDEPGNHLDLPSLTALEGMLGQFRGALIVASHDAVLLENLALDEYLLL